MTQYFIRDFNVFSVLFLFGIVLSLFGAGFGLYHWYLSAKTGSIASTGTVMVAVPTLYLRLTAIDPSYERRYTESLKDPLHTD